ncbi:hypothetical protein ACCT13_38165, partial [Rhizobium ruizarguesonis]
MHFLLSPIPSRTIIARKSRDWPWYLSSAAAYRESRSRKLSKGGPVTDKDDEQELAMIAARAAEIKAGLDAAYSV